MINLCFGMRTITVTQLPGGSYSHPNYAMDLAGEDSGIDYWFAMGRWMVIGFFGLAGTIMFTHVDDEGNVTPVHCADGIERYVTLALTHSWSTYVPRPSIGTIYENGLPMYEEGTQGQATGNHIHVEVTQGIQTTKYYDSAMKVWRMPGEINPVRTIYINKAFSKVKQTMGGAFSYCDSLYREDEPKMELPVGLSVYSKNGSAIHVVRPPEGYQMMMLSPSKEPRDTALSYINRIGIKGYDIFATVNCNYFQMRHDQSDPYGQHYGVEFSDVNDFAPKQKQWLCFYELTNGTDNFTWASDFWYAREQCRFACSPYSVNIHNGERIDGWRSSAAGNKERTPATQTMAFRLATGEWCFAVAESKVLPSQMIDLAEEWEAQEAFLLDSGGSSQMIYNGADPSQDIYYGQKVVFSGRQIPNVLALVKKKEEVPDTGDDTEDLKEQIAKLEKENALLRAAKTSLLNRIDEAIEILEGNE